MPENGKRKCPRCRRTVATTINEGVFRKHRCPHGCECKIVDNWIDGHYTPILVCAECWKQYWKESLERERT